MLGARQCRLIFELQSRARSSFGAPEKAPTAKPEPPPNRNFLLRHLIVQGNKINGEIEHSNGREKQNSSGPESENSTLRRCLSGVPLRRSTLTSRSPLFFVFSNVERGNCLDAMHTSGRVTLTFPASCSRVACWCSALGIPSTLSGALEYAPHQRAAELFSGSTSTPLEASGRTFAATRRYCEPAVPVFFLLSDFKCNATFHCDPSLRDSLSR